MKPFIGMLLRMHRCLAQLVVFAVASQVAFACGVQAPPKPGWVLPDGSKFVVSSTRVKFSAKGLTIPVQAVNVHYRAGKYVFRAPSGAREWWEIHDATILSVNGKPFAVLTLIYYPLFDKNGLQYSSLLCVTETAFYDEDGDGKFEHITSTRDDSHQVSVHVPDWVKAGNSR